MINSNVIYIFYNFNNDIILIIINFMLMQLIDQNFDIKYIKYSQLFLKSNLICIN